MSPKSCKFGNFHGGTCIILLVKRRSTRQDMCSEAVLQSETESYI